MTAEGVDEFIAEWREEQSRSLDYYGAENETRD